ncbi:unnamed protein product, partial [marine sediment metagenome]
YTSGLAANHSQVRAGRWSIREDFVKGEIIEAMFERLKTRMTFTTILMKEPSISKKHFYIIKWYAILMAKVL